MDEAPMLLTDKGKPDTTSRHVLQVLAEHASPDGSNAHPSILRIQYRSGFDRRTVQRALKRLKDGGLIRDTGEVNGRTCWKLVMSRKRPRTDWADLEAAEEENRQSAAERQRRSRAKRVTHSESVTVTHSNDVTDGDVTHSNDVSHALEMRDVTHSASARHALNAALTTNQPPVQPPGTKLSPPPAAEPAPSAPAGAGHGSLTGDLLFDGNGAEVTTDPAQPEDLGEFGAFWLVYPKRKAKQEALKAWRAAIKTGADPKHITKAATAYANERAGQDPKYTKYPATWLNKGCYDDEPDQPADGRHLRAVSGGDWQPWTNPEDQNAYYESL
jgi:hypothetical protein